jgi:glutamate-1-semialdehyde 2,1-aminomutase
VRIARAVTRRDKVLVCGYHGWHDWYIGSTTRHLGVPDAVRKLTIAFPYNDAAALEQLLKSNANEVAAIVLEPMTLTLPVAGYLEAVRQLATRHGALLVFDEIITGFRIDLGGAQRVFGVTPDLATFGKSMGNGLPISAVVGRREFMRYMEDIFFSGTFGGETLSLAASLATIAKLERNDGPRQLSALGAKLVQAIRAVLSSVGLDRAFKLVGGDWWPGLVPNPDSNHDAVLLNSLLRQELIANGVLMGATFNMSLAHNEPRIFDQTVSSFRDALKLVAAALDASDPWRLLRGEPIRPVFTVRPATSSQRR